MWANSFYRTTGKGLLGPLIPIVTRESKEEWNVIVGYKIVF